MRVQPVNFPVRAERASQACLHFCADGERCERPAGTDGFCNRHSPESVENYSWNLLRRWGAALLLAAILWPLLADVWRGFLRLLH